VFPSKHEREEDAANGIVPEEPAALSEDAAAVIKMNVFNGLVRGLHEPAGAKFTKEQSDKYEAMKKGYVVADAASVGAASDGSG
jgi:hypothetical protein